MDANKMPVHLIQGTHGSFIRFIVSAKTFQVMKTRLRFRFL